MTKLKSTLKKKACEYSHLVYRPNKREQKLLNQAKRRGYLVVTPRMDAKIGGIYSLWCHRMRRPDLRLVTKGKYDSLWMEVFQIDYESKLLSEFTIESASRFVRSLPYIRGCIYSIGELGVWISHIPRELSLEFTHELYELASLDLGPFSDEKKKSIQESLDRQKQIYEQILFDE